MVFWRLPSRSFFGIARAGGFQPFQVWRVNFKHFRTREFWAVNIPVMAEIYDMGIKACTKGWLGKF